MANMNFVRVMDPGRFTPYLVEPDDTNIYFVNSGQTYATNLIRYKGVSYEVFLSGSLESNLFNTLYHGRSDRVALGITCNNDGGGRAILYFNRLFYTAGLYFDVERKDGERLLEDVKKNFDFSPYVEPNFVEQIRDGREDFYDGLFSEDSVKEVIQLEKDLDMEVKLVSPYRSILIFKSIRVAGKEDIIADCAVSLYGQRVNIFKLLDYPNSMLVQHLSSSGGRYCWHPHIANDGSICLGNYGGVFEGLVREKNLLGATLILKSFLESWNHNNVVNDVFRNT